MQGINDEENFNFCRIFFKKKIFKGIKKVQFKIINENLVSELK
jgi:hypothetical protein